MKDPKEQKVVVLTELLDSDINNILHGIKIAGIFQKELCLFHCLGRDNKSNFLRADDALLGYKNILNKDVPSLQVSTLILDGELEKLMDELTDDHEAILMVVSAKTYKKHAKAVRESSIPFLFINNQSPNISSYKKVIAPIDLRRENSDVSLWCSYFGRFNQSEITAIAATDRDKDNVRSITKNVLSLKKLLEKFQISHKIFKGDKSSLGVQYEALDYALDMKSDVYITLGSSLITPIDKLIGLPEAKILKRAGEIPVLIINPRKDMYILCD